MLKGTPIDKIVVRNDKVVARQTPIPPAIKKINIGILKIVQVQVNHGLNKNNKITRLDVQLRRFQNRYYCSNVEQYRRYYQNWSTCF